MVEDVALARKMIRKSFRIMSSRKLDDYRRARKLRKIRKTVDAFQPWVISSAVNGELQERRDASFIYKLFLQNILLSGKL
jgi:hypothetical protein